MEQDQEVREPERVKAQGEVVLARARAKAKAREEVLRQDRAVIASVPTVVKAHPIRWVAPVMSRNVPSVERP